MEQSVELSAETRKHKTDAEMLKGTRDKTIKETREASVQTDAAEKGTGDAEAALRKIVEENSQLLGIQEALTTEIKELKAQSAKAEGLEAEIEKIKAMLKIVEEKIAEIQSKREAQIEATILKAIKDLQTSEVYRSKQVEFAIDAYGEGKHLVGERVATQYPELDLNFLDEVLEPFVTDAIWMPLYWIISLRFCHAFLFLYLDLSRSL